MKYLILWLPVFIFLLATVAAAILLYFIKFIIFLNIKRADSVFNIFDPVFGFFGDLLYKIHKL